MPTILGTAGSDTITITQNNTSVNALAGNDTITANNLSGLSIRGGLGNDTYNGGNITNSTFHFARGDGNDSFFASSFGNNNTLLFDASIRPENLILSYSFNGFTSVNVTLTIAGGGGSLTLRNLTSSSLSGTDGADVLTVKFADGFTISSQEIYDAIMNQQQPYYVAGNYQEGTANADTLTGLDTPDALRGLLGNDKLYGMAGNDALVGGDGSDLLDGGLGIDFMVGGKGNDTYLVDNLQDLIQELGNEGLDTVETVLNDYTLGNNIERLRLTGTNAINGAGNSLSNTLYGNNNSNILRGNAGDDQLFGNLGNDRLIGGKGNDLTNGGAGNDRYDFYRGDGQDTIVELSGADSLVFDNTIANNQLWFSQNGQSLVISVIGTTDQITVQDWFASNNNHVEQIKSGGKTLSDTKVQNLVNAMASLTPPAQGETTLSANYSAQLSGVIAANWS